MSGSKNILLFCIAIFASLLVTGSAYTVMSGRDFGEDFIVLLAINFPVCVLIGVIDWLVVSWLGSLLPPGRELLKVMADIAVTSAVCFMLVVGLNLILGDSPVSVTMRYALCSLPWNLIVVMMLEAQHHSRQRAVMAREKAVFQLAVLKQQLNPRTSVHSYGIGLKNISQQYRLHNKEIAYYAEDGRFVVRLPFIKS